MWKCSNVSDCRVQKRASASLSLRLPRGRPPAVGISGDFFNMTPPSAEAVTPTKDEPKPILTETVEGSVLVPAKEAQVNGERQIPIDVEKTEPISENVESAPVTEKPLENPEVERIAETIVRAEPPDYSPNPHS